MVLRTVHWLHHSSQSLARHDKDVAGVSASIPTARPRAPQPRESRRVGALCVLIRLSCESRLSAAAGYGLYRDY